MYGSRRVTWIAAWFSGNFFRLLFNLMQDLAQNWPPPPVWAPYWRDPGCQLRIDVRFLGLFLIWQLFKIIFLNTFYAPRWALSKPHSFLGHMLTGGVPVAPPPHPPFWNISIQQYKSLWNGLLFGRRIKMVPGALIRHSCVNMLECNQIRRPPPPLYIVLCNKINRIS